MTEKRENGVVPVVVVRPLDGPFDYDVPDGETLAPGDFVEVPFGPSTLAGVVWDGTPEVSGRTLKTVSRRLSAPASAMTRRCRNKRRLRVAGSAALASRSTRNQ